MTDKTTTLAELKERVAKFVDERDWAQFHSPKNLSMCIAVEAAELMELFMWVDGEESCKEVERKRQEVEDELSDILLGILCFAVRNNIDVAKAFHHKIVEVEKKYPVDKFKGSSKKYTEL